MLYLHKEGSSSDDALYTRDIVFPTAKYSTSFMLKLSLHIKESLLVKTQGTFCVEIIYDE